MQWWLRSNSFCNGWYWQFVIAVAMCNSADVLSFFCFQCCITAGRCFICIDQRQRIAKAKSKVVVFVFLFAYQQNGVDHHNKQQGSKNTQCMVQFKTLFLLQTYNLLYPA